MFDEYEEQPGKPVNIGRLKLTLTRDQIMTFVGGFSWGDDHGAGVIQAVRLKTHIGDKILEFIANPALFFGASWGIAQR